MLRRLSWLGLFWFRASTAHYDDRCKASLADCDDSMLDWIEKILVTLAMLVGVKKQPSSYCSTLQLYTYTLPLRLLRNILRGSPVPVKLQNFRKKRTSQS
jgi:hypothetical protein